VSEADQALWHSRKGLCKMQIVGFSARFMELCGADWWAVRVMLDTSYLSWIGYVYMRDEGRRMECWFGYLGRRVLRLLECALLDVDLIIPCHAMILLGFISYLFWCVRNQNIPLGANGICIGVATAVRHARIQLLKSEKGPSGFLSHHITALLILCSNYVLRIHIPLTPTPILP
jgi:hypothetical protein